MRSILLGLLILAVGCFAAPTTPPNAPSASNSAAAFPLTIVDGLQRSVTLANPPERIVSIAPRNTEMLFALGAGPKVVGVTTYCTYPPAALEVEKVGGFTSKRLSLERIVALRPDVVIAGGEAHLAVIERLDELGIPSISLSADSVAGMYDDLRLLGRVTGRAGDAERLIGSLEERIARVRQIADAIPADERRTVCYLVADQPLTVAGPASYLGEMIRLAGGVNSVEEESVRFQKVSDEVLLVRDPDVIIAPSHHASFLTPASLASRPGWTSLRAARSECIVILDGDLVSRCGPRFAEALEAIARAIYPERFSAKKSITENSP